MPKVYTKGQQRSIVTLVNGGPLSINDRTVLLSIILRLADIAVLLLLWMSKTSKWVPACLEWILRLLLRPAWVPQQSVLRRHGQQEQMS